jgi:hypothetical protein
MQKGLSLMELAKEITRTRDVKRDYIAPSNRIFFDVQVEKPQITATLDGGQTLKITRVAHGQIAEKNKIPKPYYDRMLLEAPDLLADNINTWMSRTPDKRMVRTLDGNMRAMVSDRYRPIDNDLIAEVALPIFMKHNVEWLSSQLTETRMYLQVVAPGLSGEVKPGDIVRIGLVISNSEVGLGAVNIETLIYRLICMNGAIAGTGIRRHHVGKRIEDYNIEGFYSNEAITADNTALILKIRDTIEHHLAGIDFPSHLERLRAIAENRIPYEKAQSAVEEVTGRYNLRVEEGKSILASLMEEGDFTQWGLVNGVTSLANQDTDYDRAIELQRIGGKIIDLTPDEWIKVIK